MHRSSRLGPLVGMVAALSLVVPPATAFAAGGGGTPGGAEGGADTTGSDYSDLVILLRAEDGTPLLKKFMVPDEDPEAPPTATFCVQPVSYDPIPGVPQTVSPVDGRPVWVVPLQGEWLAAPPDPLPVAEIEPCDPKPEYGMFVAEVELERLNMARTADRVMEDKLAAVQTKLTAAKMIDLDPAGRIRVDGVPIDAAPEHAAIYQSTMYSGTLPGLPAGMTNPTLVGPAPADPAYNSQFDAWELAAAAVGTAASKGVPITIDTVEYYNQVIGFPPDTTTTEYVSEWTPGVDFLRSWNPDDETSKMATGRRYVDYSGFSYNRQATYPGSVTYLDVRALEWKVEKITDAVPFSNPTLDETLTGVEAFAQMADDTRAVILYLHDNEVVLPGFYMDPVGIDTYAAQVKAIHDPAVDLGELPAEVFVGQTFGVTASLWNPHGGVDIPDGLLRVTIDAPEALEVGDVTATATEVLPFVESDGNLVGFWGPGTGFPVETGYYAATPFVVDIQDGAPLGDYAVTLDLITASAQTTPLATDTGTIKVNDDVATLLWGADVPTLTTQGSYAEIPLRVFSPDVAEGLLHLVVTGPEALQQGDVKAYGTDGLAMLTMSLSAQPDGTLAGDWPVDLATGYTDVVWYVVFTDAAVAGGYELTPSLVDGNALEPAVIAVVAAEEHGEGEEGGNEGDKEAPVVKVEVVGVLAETAAFLLDTAVEEEGVKYSCRLTKDDVAGAWEDCTTAAGGNPGRTYEDLGPGAYVFTARALDAAGNASDVVTKSWRVEEPVTPPPPPPPADTTPPVVEVTPDGQPGMSATFRIRATGDEVGARYYCRLTVDNVAGSWQECTDDDGGLVTYSDLEPASYVFSAKAVDGAGNTSDIVTYAWVVEHVYDTVPPVVVLAVNGELGSSASFTLTTDPAEEGAVFECRLEKAGETALWQDCTSGSIGVAEYTGLEPGAYVFYGRATDQAGNVSTPVTRSWTVQGVVPETFLNGGPGAHAWVLTHTERFQLGSDQEGVTYQYRVNKREYRSCDAECDVTGLVQGRNLIRFRAVLGDEVDPSPALRTVYMPQRATAMTRSDGWVVREGDAHMFGKYVVAKKRGETLRQRHQSISRIALVASTGVGYGKVHVYVGGVRVTDRPINLGGYEARTNRLIEVKSFGAPRSGVVKVVVVSKGKPVGIDAVGVMP